MSKIINGELIAEKIKDKLVPEIVKLSRRPSLAIVLVGEREDSKLYVDLKEKEAKKVGIDTHLYRCPSHTTDDELIDTINFLNNDNQIDAIMVQLPLPAHIDTDHIIKTITPKKDVDRFHPKNIEHLNNNVCSTNLLPPVFAVVKEMLNEIDYDLNGKRVCTVCNSKIFGENLSNVLKCNNAKAEFLFANDKNLSEKTRRADVLISALGSPGFIKKEMIKKDSIIIDIGVSKQEDKIRGDVDYESVKDKCAYISPVPGGVGPLTIAMTFKNTLELYKQNK